MVVFLRYIIVCICIFGVHTHSGMMRRETHVIKDQSLQSIEEGATDEDAVSPHSNFSRAQSAECIVAAVGAGAVNAFIASSDEPLICFNYHNVFKGQACGRVENDSSFFCIPMGKDYRNHNALIDYNAFQKAELFNVYGRHIITASMTAMIAFIVATYIESGNRIQENKRATGKVLKRHWIKSVALTAAVAPVAGYAACVLLQKMNDSVCLKESSFYDQYDCGQAPYSIFIATHCTQRSDFFYNNAEMARTCLSMTLQAGAIIASKTCAYVLNRWRKN